LASHALVRALQSVAAMREMIIISAEELDEIKDEARRLRQEMSDRFTPEEMDAIREQHAARAEAAERAREEMEWQIRLELARAREAEQTARKLHQEVQKVLAALKTAIGTTEDFTGAGLLPVVVRRVA
jgi:hypothetical protein